MRNLSKQYVMTLGLFLIGTLHTLIFAIFQIPENFLMGHDSEKIALACKLVLYFFAISVSLMHQILCRNFGLRKALLIGLLFNLLGIGILLINQMQGKEGLIALVFLDMVFFGMALTSVINALVTYIIIEFPKRVGMAIVILFAFFNLGSMLAPVFIGFTTAINAQRFTYPFLIFLLLLSLWFVHVYFFDPPKGARKVHMKKESLIWKLLHYRLTLFVIAIVAYGFTETTFNLWGFIQVASLFGDTVADSALPFFWMFLIIGQIVLLVPMQFFPTRKVFYFLVLVIITACFFFPEQTKLGHMVGWLAVAGFGCSAVFPILLSQMEREMIPYANKANLLSFIEKSISLMFAGYFTGVGIVDIWVLIEGKNPIFALPLHFHFAAFAIFLTCIIAFVLNWTAHKRSHF